MFPHSEPILWPVVDDFRLQVAGNIPDFDGQWLSLWNGFDLSYDALPYYLRKRAGFSGIGRLQNVFYRKDKPGGWRPIGVALAAERDLDVANALIARADGEFTLWVDGHSLSLLREIEAPHRITSIVLPRDCCTDLSPLNAFHHLVALSLDIAHAQEDQPWLEARELEALQLRGMYQHGPREIARSPSLRSLDLTLSRACSTEWLQNLPGLRSLFLSRIATSYDIDLSLIARWCPALQRLSLGSEALTTLKGIENLPRLEWLHICGGQLENLNRLTELPRLRYLKCEQSQVADISGAARSESLRSVIFDACEGDAGLESLAKFRNLAEVSLPQGATQAQFTRYIGQWPKLQSLKCTIGEDHDLSILENIPLRTLWLDGEARSEQLQPLSRLDSLRNLTLHIDLLDAPIQEPLPLPRQVESLRLWGNGMSFRAAEASESLRLLDASSDVDEDLRSLGRKPALVGLSILSDSLRSLSSANQLPSLFNLEFEGPVSTSAGFENSSQLRKVIANRSKIGRLGAIPRLDQLESLTVDGSESLETLAPLEGHARMRALTVTSCEKLRGIRAVATMPRLVVLDVSSCPAIRDFSPIGQASQLRELRLQDIEFTHGLGFLENLERLAMLDLQYATGFENLAALRSLRNLAYLNCEACVSVANIEALKGLRKLQHVNLHATQVRDVSVLASLPKLRYVDVMNTQVTDFSPLAGVLKRGGMVQVNPEHYEQLERLRQAIGSERHSGGH